MFGTKKDTKKKQIIRLWKEIFEDSDKFVELYFNRVYCDENALVIEQDGKIASALQMIPYTMMFCGKEITVAYISGACTAPAERGKGLMRQLLEHAFEEMHRRNVALSALIPADKWLFDYYRAQGYTEAFEFSVKVFTRHDYMTLSDRLVVAEAGLAPDKVLYEYFDRKMRERPACILHTYDDFVTIVKDLALSGGKCFTIAGPDHRLAGMAFALPPGVRCTSDCALVKEILVEDEQTKRHLLYEITKRYDTIKAIYRTPLDNNHTTYPYGMARVIDREHLINLWLDAHPESSVSAEKMGRMETGALTAHLLGYPQRKAYMSLMLD